MFFSAHEARCRSLTTSPVCVLAIRQSRYGGFYRHYF